jgi:uncharacterized membrane protein YhaH (DUF805 family)
LGEVEPLARILITPVYLEKGEVMDWYIAVIKKYAVFSGRAHRKEYWYFVLFNILISIGLSLLDGAIGTVNADTGYGLLGSIYSLSILIPSLAVLVRRLHDTSRSAWWILIGLVPVIGWIVLLVFAVQDSHPGQNQYGANPKDATT